MRSPVVGTASLVFLFGCSAPASPSSGADSQHAEAEVKSNEQVFWTWFAENEQRLRTAVKEDARAVVENDPMNAELDRIHPSLLFELSEAPDGKHELIISADGDHNAFPAVEALVQAAPTLEHWSVTAFRQPSADLNFELAMGEIVLSPQTVLYRSAPDGDKLAITIYLPGDVSKTDAGKMASFLLLDHILGEYDVETQLGAIDWAVLPSEPGDLAPLAKLRDEVASRKR